jgi:hypothetical protein
MKAKEDGIYLEFASLTPMATGRNSKRPAPPSTVSMLFLSCIFRLDVLRALRKNVNLLRNILNWMQPRSEKRRTKQLTKLSSPFPWLT